MRDVGASEKVRPGMTVRQFWKLSNTGSQAWVGDCRIRHIEGEKFSTFSSFSVPALNPDETTKIEVNLVAPRTCGTFTGVWQLYVNGRALGKPIVVELTTSITVPVVGFPSFPLGYVCSVFPGLSSTLKQQQEYAQMVQQQKKSESTTRS